MQLQGKRVTVFGVNRSGVAAAKLLSASGATVTVTDTRNADALSREIADLDDGHTSDQTDSPYQKFLGGHPPECIADADFIVVSPGVPLEIPILGDARARNLPILAELEVAASTCPAPIVAITGTKGKSTTTLLTASNSESYQPVLERLCRRQHWGSRWQRKSETLQIETSP